mmetsp:Transcript_21561/g.42348  ORF Transcript_21561/g.42348 Transcript_21561/m.42348 type:complete len:95 (+) Transcript_21561:104-388(+)|eukprot:CAMPEP_0171515584 /NCGR_PEP_ID=MMETSP0959-20130129/3545_1 /TAXON_ID=87120 /ORGANISM="Aurantiochytrium limacinum, Strain ATCCMYA-1381" /LENGTH=94 /DNA_ID=CAMNT_0012054165 /DNA_START=17 /DNA_END=301 /DNA_ORIENTATION=-
MSSASQRGGVEIPNPRAPRITICPLSLCSRRVADEVKAAAHGGFGSFPDRAHGGRDARQTPSSVLSLCDDPIAFLTPGDKPAPAPVLKRGICRG